MNRKYTEWREQHFCVLKYENCSKSLPDTNFGVYTKRISLIQLYEVLNEVSSLVSLLASVLLVGKWNIPSSN